jgi:hypothetical protein
MNTPFQITTVLVNDDKSFQDAAKFFLAKKTHI